MSILSNQLHSVSYPPDGPRTPVLTPLDEPLTTPSKVDTITALESSFFDPRVTWNTADPFALSPDLLRTPPLRQHPRFGFGLSTPSHRVDDDVVRRRARADGLAGYSPVMERSGRRKDVGSGPPSASKRSAAVMQTPPPTSTVRRKTQKDVERKPRQDGDPDSDMEQLLQTPSRVSNTGLFGETPALFAGTPPLMRSFTSPIPRGRPLWSDEPGFSMDIPSSFDDPFGPDMGDDGSNFGAFNRNCLSSDPPLPGFSLMPMPSSFEAAQPFPPTTFSTSPHPHHAVDPALCLSSPARRIVMQSSPVRPERQPYHHQTEESKREQRLKEIRRARSVQRRAEAASGRLSSLPNISTKGSASGSVRSPRNRPISASIPQAPLESLVLKIGKDGRATTEMLLTHEPSRSKASSSTAGEESTESDTESDLSSDFGLHSGTASRRLSNPDLSLPPRPSNVSLSRAAAASTSGSASAQHTRSIPASRPQSTRSQASTITSHSLSQHVGHQLQGPTAPHHCSRSSTATATDSDLTQQESVDGDADADDDDYQDDDEDGVSAGDDDNAKGALKQLIQGRRMQRQRPALGNMTFSTPRARGSSAQLPSQPSSATSAMSRLSRTSGASTWSGRYRSVPRLMPRPPVMPRLEEMKVNVGINSSLNSGASTSTANIDAVPAALLDPEFKLQSAAGATCVVPMTTAERRVQGGIGGAQTVRTSQNQNPLQWTRCVCNSNRGGNLMVQWLV